MTTAHVRSPCNRPLPRQADQFDDRVVIPLLLERSAQAAGPIEKGAYFDAPDIDLGGYDRIVVCMSGGKDSLASLCRLFDMGADRSRIELWHHDVDGREGSTLMDWPFMASYNRALAQAFDLPLYFSWLDGGFEGEMLKQDSYSRAHMVETPDGLVRLERDTARSQPGTRRRFPQQAASLQTRWCSSALKIDVGRRALNNQARFDGQRVLFITGERREESANRARYNQLEPHACDRRQGRKARHVDAWRPVLNWSEDQVWDALRRHGIAAPVPYRLGWGRSSCMTCIYNSPRVWATLAHYFPERVQRIADYEREFATTISRARIDVLEQAARASPFEIHDAEALLQASCHDYTLPVLTSGAWKMPAGAFGAELCGAT